MNYALLLTCLGALVAQANAQTFTSCDPLNTTCPADTALGTTFNQTFSTTSSLSSTYWTTVAGPPVAFQDSGAQFTIYEHGDSPTIQTNFYIFFGRVEVLMQAAAGQGIISSIVLLSDDLDEIDWEVMGGNTTSIETNYYGKGNRSQINSEYFACNNPQSSMHNYTTIWTQDSIEWHLDGNIVRTLLYADAVNSGQNIFPQTPCYLKIGNWAGGDPSEPKGTIQWAGGVVNYDNGPFTMQVQSVKVTDAQTNASSYLYTDHSGTWQSIKVNEGVSNVNQAIHAPPPLSLSQRWQNLPAGAKLGVAIGAVAVGVICALILTFCCVKQRRIGRRERALADAQWDREQAEIQAYKEAAMQKQMGKKGGFVQVHEQMI